VRSRFVADLGGILGFSFWNPGAGGAWKVARTPQIQLVPTRLVGTLRWKLSIPIFQVQTLFNYFISLNLRSCIAAWPASVFLSSLAWQLRLWNMILIEFCLLSLDLQKIIIKCMFCAQRYFVTLARSTVHCSSSQFFLTALGLETQ
jgi:hypothetical protein